MKKYILEVCCGSAESAIAAFQAGADRVELNTDLFHGGLTPSIGSLLVVKSAFPDKPVMCMVRPRESGFCYSETETAVMMADAKSLLAAGADGLVFGFLKNDGSVDEDNCRKILDILQGKEAVFHRAFDLCPDWHAAMDSLIQLGFTRILTSGQKATAPQGMETLKEMIAYANGKIEILPGCGIRLANIQALRDHTGAVQFHSGLSRQHFDRSCTLNPLIHFTGTLPADEAAYSKTSTEDVAALLSLIRSDSAPALS